MVVPEVKTYRGLVVAPEFERRQRIRSRYNKWLKTIHERNDIKFESQSGYYGNEELIRTPHEFSTRPLLQSGNTHKLNGLELFWSDQIKKRLKIKTEGDPVVVMDLGGMRGYSWSRLALQYQEEVEASQVAFVVSNLQYSPEEEDLDQVRNAANLKAVAVEARPLVHYLVGDVRKLRKSWITLKNGKDYPLLGNVDLIHERFSMAYWSLVPELEVLEAASLLSDFGMYHIQKGMTEIGDHSAITYNGYINDHKDRIAALGGSDSYRRNGLYLALLEMQRRFDLGYIPSVQEGDLKGEPIVSSYIFNKQQAPLIVVNR